MPKLKLKKICKKYPVFQVPGPGNWNIRLFWGRVSANTRGVVSGVGYPHSSNTRFTRYEDLIMIIYNKTVSIDFLQTVHSNRTLTPRQSIWLTCTYLFSETTFFRICFCNSLYWLLLPFNSGVKGKIRLGVVDGWAVSAAACHAGGPGLIPGPGQTYV
jgi:hypothetical protein